MEWNRTYGYTEDDRAFSVIESSDGGYLFAGNTRPYENELDRAYIVKVDESGEPIWSNYFGGEHGQRFEDFIETRDGGFVGVGWQLDGTHTGGDFYVLKASSDGEMIWSNVYGKSRDSVAYSVIEMDNKDLVVVGASGIVGGNDNDVHIIRIDKYGKLIWETTFGGNEHDIGNSITSAWRGGFVIGGESSSSGNGLSDMYFLKMAEEDLGIVSAIPAVPLFSVVLAVTAFVLVRNRVFS